MSDSVKRRRLLLWTMAVVVVASIIGTYSLMGRITGVYRLPELDGVVGPVKGYLVLDGDRWCAVMLWDGRAEVSGQAVPTGEMDVVLGIWVVDLHLLKKTPAEIIRAYTPTNLFDVLALRSEPLSGKVKAFSTNWLDPVSGP